LRAYDACEYLVKQIGDRGIGSEGEKRAGDWIERELSTLGYETRRLWFDCPAWDHRGTWLTVDGERVKAGAQMYSPSCDIEAELLPIRPDGKGGFSGDARGKIAVMEEAETGEVLARGKLARALKASGTFAAIIVSSLPETWSTKLFRDPASDFPSAAVSAGDGAGVLRKIGSRARLVIDARQRNGKTSDIIAETGPQDASVFLVGAHYDAAPCTPGARDNASGTAVLLELAERFSKVRLTRRLRFCAFSGHEFGGDDAKPFGSKSYVQSCTRELTRVALMFNLDGSAGRPGSHLLLAVYGGERLFSRVNGFAASMPDVTAEQATSRGSDHAVFVDAGIEAVWLRSTDDGTYYATVYHSPLDDMTWVDESEIERSAELAFRFLSDFMQMPTAKADS
jgi:Iap family predicted aminopeptidase